MSLKKFFIISALLVAALQINISAVNAYTNSRMIDDSVFDNVSSMSEQEIRSFILSRPNTCLTRVGSGYGGGNVFPEPIDYWTYSGNVDAARVIWKAAQHWGLNPQVILVTLQKEQSLLTDNDCIDNDGFERLPKAMGYACFEGSNQCPQEWARGFSKQVMKGAWQLKFDKERAYGNIAWDGDGDVPYRGRMTEGIRKRCAPTCREPDPSLWEDIYYDGWTMIDGQRIFIENGATAALYNYTPHLNQSFPVFFTQYFGDPSVDANKDTPLVGDWDGDGKDSVGIRRGNRYFLDFDNDGVEDIEFGFGLTTDEHLVGDWDGDGSDEIGLKRGERYYFSTDFNGTSEIYQGFGNPTDQAVVGDWDGDRRDEIGLKRSERYFLNFDYDGKAELYLGFGNPSDGVFVGDWDGDGDDNLALRQGVRYRFDFGHDAIADASFGYGSSFHSIVVGDWDGDRADSMGLKNGEFYYLDNNFDGKTDIYTGIGQRTDRGVIGDWDEDDRDSIGAKRARNYFLDDTFDGKAETYFSYKY